jgi:RNA recognition motif-containing protein
VSCLQGWRSLLLVSLLQNDDDTSRGFGFVNFEEADGAQAAVSALNGKEMEDKELYVGRAQKKSEREAALKQRYSLLSDRHVAFVHVCAHGAKSQIAMLSCHKTHHQLWEGVRLTVCCGNPNTSWLGMRCKNTSCL